MRPDQILEVTVEGGRRKPATLKSRPGWVDSSKMLSREHVRKFNHTEFKTWPRTTYEGERVSTEVVFKEESDIIFQFTFKKKLRVADFNTFLAEVIEQHFGTTTPFFLDFVKELDSWALLAVGVRGLPMYNPDHYTVSFLTLLDLAIGELEKA